jgi:hypothetical protein
MAPEQHVNPGFSSHPPFKAANPDAVRHRAAAGQRAIAAGIAWALTASSSFNAKVGSMAKIRAMQMVAVAVLCGTAGLAGAVALLGIPTAPKMTHAAAKPTIVAQAKPVAAVKPAAVAKPAAPAPDPGYVVKRILTVKSPFVHGDYYWDEAGVPDGPVVVTVDLAAQVLSVFRGGYEIGTAVMVYGADEKPTPLGVFGISQKDAHHVSNLYNAPMPYMLRLTNDGIGAL